MSTRIQASPNAPRPSDPLTLELAGMLRRIQANYEREGSGPGSRFEGRLLEDVQAEAAVREIRGRCDRDAGTGLLTDNRTASTAADPSPGLAVGRFLAQHGADVHILGSQGFGRPDWGENLAVTLPDGTTYAIEVRW